MRWVAVILSAIVAMSYADFAAAQSNGCIPGYVSIACQQMEQERAQRDQAARRAAEARERAAVAARAEQARQAREAAEAAKIQARAELRLRAEERGYREMTLEDFKVDGKELAASHARVSLTGTYMKIGNGEWMTPGTIDTPYKIGLLTEDAQRDTRRRMFECQERTVGYLASGCAGITLLGTATTCTHKSLGEEIAEPCLSVEDSYVAP